LSPILYIIYTASNLQRKLLKGLEVSNKGTVDSRCELCRRVCATG